MLKQNQEINYFFVDESRNPYFCFLVDIYDSDKYPKSYYHKRNPFDVNKISPL